MAEYEMMKTIGGVTIQQYKTDNMWFTDSTHLYM